MQLPGAWGRESGAGCERCRRRRLSKCDRRASRPLECGQVASDRCVYSQHVGILNDAVWCSDLDQNVHCSAVKWPRSCSPYVDACHDSNHTIDNMHVCGALIIAGIFPVGHATRLPSSGFFFDAAIWRDNPVEPMDFRCAKPRRSINPQPLPFWACRYILFACCIMT